MTTAQRCHLFFFRFNSLEGEKTDEIVRSYRRDNKNLFQCCNMLSGGDSVLASCAHTKFRTLPDAPTPLRAEFIRGRASRLELQVEWRNMQMRFVSDNKRQPADAPPNCCGGADASALATNQTARSFRTQKSSASAPPMIHMRISTSLFIVITGPEIFQTPKTGAPQIIADKDAARQRWRCRRFF